jgi:hypothetical protein
MRRSVAKTATRAHAVERALRIGPIALGRPEQFALLQDAVALEELRRAAMTAPVHASWYASSAAGARATIRHFGARERERLRTLAVARARHLQ